MRTDTGRIHAVEYGSRVIGIQFFDDPQDLADHIAPINEALNALSYAAERCLSEDPEGLATTCRFPANVLAGLTLLSSLAVAMGREVEANTAKERRRSREATT